MRDVMAQAGELPKGTRILMLIHGWWGHAERQPCRHVPLVPLADGWWRTVQLLASLPGPDAANRKPHPWKSWRRTADVASESWEGVCERERESSWNEEVCGRRFGTGSLLDARTRTGPAVFRRAAMV